MKIEKLAEIVSGIDFILLDEQRKQIAYLIYGFDKLNSVEERIISERQEEALVGVLNLLDNLYDANHESQKKETHVTLRIKYNPNEYPDPSAWDWSALTDIDPEDIEVI